MAKTMRMKPSQPDNQPESEEGHATSHEGEAAAPRTMRMGSTEELSASKRETLRMGAAADTLRAGPGGGAPTLRARGAEPIHAGATADFSAFRQDQLLGRKVDLNGITYEISDVVSEEKTGEADIYLVRGEQGEYIYKKYKRNIVPKQDVLSVIKELNHEHLIRLVDYGTIEGTFFELMEYAAGGTLEQHAPIRDVNRIREIVGEVTDALGHCHTAGLIHRDIKPENLFCRNTDGTHVLMADFGIASMLDEGQERRITNRALTVSYAAPETVGGFDGRTIVGPEADYFSFGLTLVALWLGDDPFGGRPPGYVSHLIITGNIELPPDLPKEVETLIRGLITHNYVDRWGYDEVSRWLQGENVPVAEAQAREETGLEPFDFVRTEEGVRTARSLEEMAGLLIEFRDEGAKHLYRGDLSEWVKPVDRLLAGDLKDIVEEDPERENSYGGVLKAVYLLDPGRGFIDRDWTEFPMADSLETTLDRIAARIDGAVFSYGAEGSEYDSIAGSAYAQLEYLDFFLQAKGQHALLEQIESYREEYLELRWSEKKLVSKLVLLLEEGDSFRFGDRHFSSFDDLRTADEETQRALVRELHNDDCKFLCWMEEMALKSDSLDIAKAPTTELVELIREMPWLKEFDDSLAERLNQRYESGWTDLMRAAKAGDVELCKELISGGADDSYRADDGLTAFGVAALHERRVIMDYLRELGTSTQQAKINPEVTPEQGYLIHLLAQEGVSESVAYLLQHGANPNKQRKTDGFTPLMVAAGVGHHRVIELLLKAGADPSIPDKREMTPLHYAAGDGDLDLIQMLADHGAPVDEPADYPPMLPAAGNGQVEAIKLLHSLGADPDRRDIEEQAGPLTVAAQRGELESVKTLISLGADVNIGYKHLQKEDDEDDRASTPLAYAAWKGHRKIVQELVAAGADPNVSFNGCPVLYERVANDASEVVKMLLHGGADPRVFMDDEEKWTPFFVAIQKASHKSLELLAKTKKGVNQRDGDVGSTPLHYAAYKGDLKAVEILLRHGAKPRLKDKEGWTPIELAADRGHRRLAKRMMGRTNLILSVARVVNLLLKTGAILLALYTFVWATVNSYFLSFAAGVPFWYTVAAGAIGLNLLFWYLFAFRVRYAVQRYEKSGVLRLTIKHGILGAVLSLLLSAGQAAGQLPVVGDSLSGLSAQSRLPAPLVNNIWLHYHPASAETYLAIADTFPLLGGMSAQQQLAVAFLVAMVAVGVLAYFHGRRTDKLRRIKAAVEGRK
jgi:ankyrin repeat protein/serine/threonine protein kinase